MGYLYRHSHADRNDVNQVTWPGDGRAMSGLPPKADKRLSDASLGSDEGRERAPRAAVRARGSNSEATGRGQNRRLRISGPAQGQVTTQQGNEQDAAADDADTVTAHGFRSSFRDWAGNETFYPRDLIETALTHVIGEKTEQAYCRSDALEKRRKLMEAWASYCEPKANSNVLHLR
jgi:hypothetical protein